jgi:hypothetical protein
LTLQTIESLIQRYGNHSNLLGIELMNEPSEFLSEQNHTALLNFYIDAYSVVRKYNKNCYVVFNELYEKCYILWKKVLQEPDFYNVIVDWHLYNWQQPFTNENKQQHIQDAKKWESLIDIFNVQHPIIIGEWCMSTGTFVQAGQPFVDNCLNSFQKSFGWYLWNWKIERDVHFDEWDVQLQMHLKNGLKPIK